MIEDELRDAFARHETLAPPTGPVRAAIERTVVRRRRRRFRLRVGGSVLALVIAALVGVPAFAPDRHQETATLLLEPAPATPTGALNLLLLGLDAAGPDASRRADSILLVHVPADRSRLYLVSLPRDLEVSIPGHGKGKLNHAFEYGGGARSDLGRGYRLTRRVVTEVTGVPIDAGAVLTYPALRKLTDAVGGVPVCLPTTIRSHHTLRVYPAGCRQLDGAAAVDVLRQRIGMPDGGLDRDRNAQRYAAGLLRRIGERGGLTDPALLNTLLTQAGSGLTVETGQTSLPTLLSVAGKAAAAEPVALGLPVRYTEGPFWGFRLDRSAAPAFLAALREDRLGEWTAAHPDRVTRMR